MAEIPEHLRKRAEEARRKAEAKKAAEAGGADAPADAPAADAGSGESAGDSRIPAHLLERSKAAYQAGISAAREAAAGVDLELDADDS